MCMVDLEPCSVWNEAFPKARIPHRCAACRGTIPVGERHLRLGMMFEGEWSAERACMSCWNDIEEFGSADGHMKCAPSGFSEVLSECVEKVYDEATDENIPAGEWAPMLARFEARIDAARAAKKETPDGR
jgi:hypothetical protein